MKDMETMKKLVEAMRAAFEDMRESFGADTIPFTIGEIRNTLELVEEGTELNPWLDDYLDQTA